MWKNNEKQILYKKLKLILNKNSDNSILKQYNAYLNENDINLRQGTVIVSFYS